jgi:hypothetical protein
VQQVKVEETEVLTGLVIMYAIVRPRVTVESMYRGWHNDPVLSEYRQPSLDRFLEIIKEVKK